ncbi:MAG: DNA repair protein RadC [Candidatus Scalindua rubra]|uniref:DNA repair protein RadC n=1 Tax=Candidatus Scalindua rubra TaxID=1872076 RepID=A0A1E3XDM4_9BACT|nr:MAG: DNA repair protein RadC [Candidatus Scalindua rubra]
MPKKAYYCIGKNARSPENVAKIFKNLQKETAERFLVVYLNCKSVIESFQCVYVGTLNHCPISPLQVFQGALLANVNRIICIHNHPGGSAKPSNNDIEITKQLRNAGEIMDIKLVEHIIIGEKSFYSFKYDKTFNF